MVSILRNACAILLVTMVSGCGPGSTDPEEGHRPTIVAFDTYAGTDSILVVWNTGNYPPFDLDSRPAAPQIHSVWLRLAGPGPGDDFETVARHERTGTDSTYLTGLQAQASYRLVLETHGEEGALIDRSRVLQTQLGPTLELLATFGEVGGDGGLYYAPLGWSRDGGDVFWILGNRSNGFNLVAHDVTTGTERTVTTFPMEPAILTGVAVAPDSDRIAFSYSSNGSGGPYGIHVVDLRTGIVRRLTEGPVDSSPAWGRGGRLYFTRGTNGSPNIPQIYSTNANAADTSLAVLESQQYKYGLSVDPAGARIAYSGYSSGAGDIRHQALYAVTLATGGVERLLADSGSDNHAPAWSASGAEIYFVSDFSGHFEAWSLDVASGQLTQRTRARRRGAECWAARPSPDGFRLALFMLDPGEFRGRIEVVRLP